MSPAPKRRAARKPTEAPTEAPELAESAAADQPAETPPVPPAREDRRAWWCGVCDHSNTLLTQACGNCGTEKADA